MGNAFDFELTASDQASASIQRIEEAVKNLLPDLDKTREGLKLGGQESTEGIDDLNTRLKGMGQFARDGVQFIGDLVPPLKMVGGLTFGLGGAATVINVVKNSLSDFASTGYRIETTAKNISMTTQAFQELTGAMIENGTERKEAESSLSGLFSQANDAAHGRNAGFLAILSQAGIGISETKEGLADVDKLVTDLNKHMQTLSPGQQALFASKLNLPPELLSLLRKTTNEVKQLKDQAQRDGLIINENDLKNAAVLKDEFNRTSAAWDGLISRMRAGTGALMAGSGTGERLKQRRSIVTTDQGKIDRMSNDDDFKSRLGYFDKLALSMGTLTDSLREKYQNEYGLKDRVEGFASDVSGMRAPPPINTPYALPGEDQQQVRLKQLESQYNLPPTILDRVYQAESGRGKNLLSPKGAQGPFQFMPPTGRDYGLNSMDDRMDFNKSSEAAAKYLSDLLKMFDGDVNKAVASYNWGQGNVKNYGLGQAPAETRNYLQKIMPGLPAIHPQPGELTTAPSDINALSPASINSSQQSGRDINDITQDRGGEKSEIEITLITDKTGERQKITAQKGAKISTSMSYPS
ncbi:lytic transglycosylase domain-containing protein [Yersinia massiliensis]|uniref:lytic transglycosylase domain-containing protein n=1 Tax=Yersinia massiliensis TaxID=419257 RepID=UPI0003159B3F|nr:lytic transglycosylase domain-containing protein [Yersinia massiliensis]